MATKKIAATKNNNASAKKENNAAMEKKIDRLTSEIVAQILANVDLNAIVKKVVAENPAPVKEAKVEEKPRFTEKQLAAQKAWGERQKERAATFNTLKSPEYQELWATWKANHADEYGEATKRADKQALNKAGHKWVMEQLAKESKKSAAPAKKAPAVKMAAAKKVAKK